MSRQEGLGGEWYVKCVWTRIHLFSIYLIILFDCGIFYEEQAWLNFWQNWQFFKASHDPNPEVFHIYSMWLSWLQPKQTVSECGSICLRFVTVLCIFARWEEAGVPGENPHMHRENFQTPHRKAPAEIWTRNKICFTLWISLCLTHFIRLGWRKPQSDSQWNENITVRCTEIEIMWMTIDHFLRVQTMSDPFYNTLRKSNDDSLSFLIKG